MSWFQKKFGNLKRFSVIAVLCLVGCDLTDSQPKPPQPKQPEGKPISRFWFNYKWNPEPRFRLWERDGDGIWTETYPSGFRSTFGGKKRMRVHGLDGDFVVKYKGDEGSAETGNGNFGVFIQDYDGYRRPIHFVHKNNGRWMPEKSSLFMDVLELRDGTVVDEFPQEHLVRRVGQKPDTNF